MELSFQMNKNGIIYLGPYSEYQRVVLLAPPKETTPDQSKDTWPDLYNWDFREAAQKAENERCRGLLHFLDATNYLKGPKIDAPYPCPDKVEPVYDIGPDRTIWRTKPADPRRAAHDADWMDSAVEQWMKMHPPEEDFVDGGITVDDIAQDDIENLGEHDPHGIAVHTPGAKLDAGKNRLALVLGGFARAIQAVGEIGTAGAKKYTDRGWLRVPDGVDRYSDALMRHLSKEWEGEMWDPDSGQMHAAHAAWNALARLELLLLEQESTRDN